MRPPVATAAEIYQKAFRDNQPSIIAEVVIFRYEVFLAGAGGSLPGPYTLFTEVPFFYGWRVVICFLSLWHVKNPASVLTDPPPFVPVCL